MDERSSNGSILRRGNASLPSKQTSERWFEKPAFWSGGNLPNEPGWDDKRPERPNYYLWLVLAFYSGVVYVLLTQWFLKRAKEHKR